MIHFNPSGQEGEGATSLPPPFSLLLFSTHWEKQKAMRGVLYLTVIDLLAYYVSLLLAYWARVSLFPRFLPTPKFSFTLFHYLALWWIPLILLSFLAYERLYTQRFPFWDETLKLIKALSAGFLVILAVVSLGKMSRQVSRLILVSMWLFSIFLFPLFRLWGKRFLVSRGLWVEKIVIMGAGNAGRALAQGLEREKTMGYDIVGFLDDDPEKQGARVETSRGTYPVLGPLSSLKEVMDRSNVRTVAIAIPSLGLQKLREMVNQVYLLTHQVLLVPELKGITLMNSQIIPLFMEQLFLLKLKNNLKSPLNRAVKRAFDLVVGSVILLILAPFMGVVALAISLESAGGPFFIQDRLGRRGRLFRCIKFRSMFKNADAKLQEYLDKNPQAKQEWEEFKKLKGFDPRVTKVGKFLRKTSLDELPQLINVIKGDMSLVGPRPYLPREREDMGDYFTTIMVAKPGITGLWQVSGRNELPFKERLILDTWYVQNWSLWLDIVILFKTVKVLLKREGAY